MHVDVFCLFLREKGVKSELHFAINVVLNLSIAYQVNYCKLLAVNAACSRTRNFLRLLADRILIFLRLELLADKAQFNSLFADCVFLRRKNFLRHYFWAVLLGTM